MERISTAALNPQELMSLRLLRGDSRSPIPSSHRQRLLSMGLIGICADELRLTEAGRSHVAVNDANETRPRGRPAGPLFYLG
jgi:hypothetical protein